MDPYKYRPSSSYNTQFTTTNAGAPVYNNESALTVGARGETDPFDRNPNQRAGCRSNPKANCDKNPKPVPCKYKRNCRDRPPMGHP